MLGELLRGQDGVPAIGRDEGVWHGADPLRAPPRRLGVGGDPDGTGDMGGPAVAGLDQPMVVPRGEEHHLLGRGGLDHAPRIGADAGAAREDAEVEGLEVGESVVRPLDQHHRFPRLDLVAIMERVHGEVLPLHRAELEDRDRLVHAPQEGVRLAEDLHRDAGSVSVGEEDLAGTDEILIRVVPRPHLVDGEVEDRGVQAGRARWRHE